MASSTSTASRLTAAVAAWLVDRVRQVGEEQEAVTRRDLQALTAEIARLQAGVAALTAERTAAPPGP
ncbi:hypothetical protein [Blastococcus sp. SYSU D01042]